MDYDWSGVPERVAALAADPGADKVFGAAGAGGHHFALEPPLEPAELAELERQLGVRLPGEYRSFLLTVGRGGAGPGYGLFPLRRVDGRWRWVGDGADETSLDRLAEPFPHAEPVNPTAELGPAPDADEFDSTEEWNAAEDAYWERYHRIESDPGLTVGALFLCHEGCGYQYLLVVSGPQRGQMWSDGRPDGSGINPVLDAAGERIGFARWYLDWLDRAIADARRPRLQKYDVGPAES